VKIRKSLLLAAAVALGAIPAAYAAEPTTGVLQYPSSFFADARPSTAYDMIDRVPGFVFDDGNTERGFAGTAGNVLIDGQRPTSKTDDLESVLKRIPASNVERIDVIRGGAPGIDMQGQTVVANVIRKKTDSTHIVVQADDQLFLNDHHTIPTVSVEYTKHSGDSIYEASISRDAGYDDAVGKGFHNITDVTTGTVTKQNARYNGFGFGGSFTGAVTTPLFSGQFKANLALQTEPFHSDFFYTAPGFLQEISDKSGQNNGELGLHWQGDVGSVQLETLLLQRLSHQTDLNISDAPGDSQRFHNTSNTGESIARATVRYLPTTSLTLETGLEGAYNFLNGNSDFLDNGVVIPLPSGEASVNEKRGEAFAQGTWKISDEWLVEGGARFELSTISSTKGVIQSRTFFYPKPRAVVTWSPDKETQVRVRYERVLGQLDFNNFVASSNLSGTGVTAGNADIKPDQHTQYEISFERHFMGKGAIVASYMHEEIKDVVDYVPITNSSGTFDAPGNIGNGTNDQFKLNLTLPLDWLGLKNGLLTSTNTIVHARVKDPVTGVERDISPGQSRLSSLRPQDIELTLTQDIDSLKSTWGIFYYNCWSEHYYRLSSVERRRTLPPYVEMWWDYKPTPDWSFRLELYNPFRFSYDDKFYDFAGPRNVASLSQIEEIRIKSQPRIYFRIRKTFD
jgi:hypothetical protein